MTGLQCPAQGRTLSQQVGLPDVLIEGARTQSIGQRPIRAVAHRHLPACPITSTPAGGTKENKSAVNLALRFELLKVNCVT